MRLPGLLRRNAADHVSTERQRLFDMESSLFSARISISIQDTQNWCSHSLSREPLANNFGVLMNEEVLDGTLVAPSSGRLGERPASS